MTHLKKLDDSPPIDLSEWNFGFDKMDPIIAEAVSEAITNTFAEEDYGGLDIRLPANGDLTAMLLDVPFGKDEPVTFKFSLIDVICEEIRFIDDQEIAVEMRDKFVQLAALLHKTAFPKEEIPRLDLERETLPAFYRGNLNLDQLWNWDTYAPAEQICKSLEADVTAAKAAIDVLRTKKIMLETALIHYKGLADKAATPQTTSDTQEP